MAENLSLINRLKLAKLLMKFAEIRTREGVTLTMEGELEVGREVFITNEQGDLAPAPDGVYTAESGEKITVTAGKVSAIEDTEVEVPETTEAPAEEAAEEEAPEAPAEAEDKDAEIDRLRARIAELEAENAELKARLDETEENLKAAEEKLAKPVDTPSEEQLKEEKPEAGNRFLKRVRM